MRERLKWTIRRSLKSRGWVVRKQPILIDFLHSRDVDLVVDIGANVGQFGGELRQWGYRGNIVSFEPGGNAYELLTRNSGSDSRWETRQMAMGSTPGTIRLDVTRSTVFSSIRPQSDAAKAYGADAEVIGHEDVPVETLDNFLATRAEKRIFVKIDTQGFEPEVVAGMTRHFDRIVGVQMELPLVQLYEGNWSLPDALNTMASKGFEVAQVGAVNHLKDDPVSATELDCVFRRA